MEYFPNCSPGVANSRKVPSFIVRHCIDSLQIEGIAFWRDKPPAVVDFPDPEKSGCFLLSAGFYATETVKSL